jgi:hypothetical protein
MAFTTCSVATNNIQTLDDQPNDVGGLSADELKAMFDKFGAEFVAWFNATHIPELDENTSYKIGNYQITYNASEDSLDFVYLGV